MIKDNQKFFNQLHIMLDGVGVIASFLIAWYIKFGLGILESDRKPVPFRTYLLSLIFIVPGYIIIYSAFHLYTSKRIQRIRNEFVNIIKANIIGLLLFLTILYITKQQHFSRSMLFIFFIVNVVNSIIFRVIVYKSLFSLRKRGFNLKHVLLVGYSNAAKEYIDRVLSYKEWGYEVHGILDDNIEIDTQYKGIKVLGKIDSLNDELEKNTFDEIVITLELAEYTKLSTIVNECEKSGVHTQFIPDYDHIIPTRPYTEDLMGLPVINIRYVPLSVAFNSFVKRLFDIVLSLVGIILIIPLLTIISILIKLTSRGSLIFKQERVGLHGKKFMMYKFRTMCNQNKSQEQTAWTVKNDPRVTKIGKILRKTSLDELPQLFNILKGDMSLVGPRPERPYFVEKFKEEIPRYMVKHQVRPGLTGWAQINGLRGDTSIRKRIEYDLYYIENWSIEFDFKILVLTLFKGIINKNAY